MITTAANSRWPDDISLESRFAECGLPVPCLIRMAKIATVTLIDAPSFGCLPADLLDQVRIGLRNRLAI